MKINKLLTVILTLIFLNQMIASSPVICLHYLPSSGRPGYGAQELLYQKSSCYYGGEPEYCYFQGDYWDGGVLKKGITVNVATILAEIRSTYSDANINLPNAVGDMVMLNAPGSPYAGYDYADKVPASQPYESFLNFYVVHAYAPLTVLKSEWWYDHSFSVSKTAGTTVATSLSVSVGVKKGIGSVSFKAGWTRSTTESLTQTGSTITARGGETKYVYFEGYFVRIQGFVKWAKYERGSGRYLGAETIYYDSMVLLDYDLTELEGLTTKYGEFPSVGTPNYLQARQHLSYTLAIGSAYASSSSWGFSVGLDGERFSFSGEFSREVTNFAETTFEHQFSYSSGSGYSEGQRLSGNGAFIPVVENAVSANLFTEKGRPDTYTNSGSSTRGFLVNGIGVGTVPKIRKYDRITISGWVRDFTDTSLLSASGVAKVRMYVNGYESSSNTAQSKTISYTTAYQGSYSGSITIPYISSSTRFVYITVKVWDHMGNMYFFQRALENKDYSSGGGGGGSCKGCVPV